MPKAVMHLEDLVDDASYRSFTASQAGHGKSLTSRLALPNSRDVETGEHQAFVGCVIALKVRSLVVRLWLAGTWPFLLSAPATALADCVACTGAPAQTSAELVLCGRQQFDSCRSPSQHH